MNDKIVDFLKDKRDLSSNVVAKFRVNDRLCDKVLDLSIQSFMLRRDAMKPCCVKIKDDLLFEASMIDFEIKKIMKNNSNRLVGLKTKKERVGEQK